jgi:uncharacterized membrane protein
LLPIVIFSGTRATQTAYTEAMGNFRWILIGLVVIVAVVLVLSQSTAVVSFFNYPSFVMNFGILIGIPLLLGLILGFFLGMRQARPKAIKSS